MKIEVEDGGIVNENLNERAKSQAYLFSILLSAMVVRIIVGLVHPTMGLEGGIIVGLATVVCMAPTLYRLFYNTELIDTRRKRLSHTAAMVLSAGLFVTYVALPV